MVISHKHEQHFFSNATFLRFIFLTGGLLLVFQSCNYGTTDLSRSVNIEVPIFTLNRIMSSEEILKKMLASDTKNDLVASVQNTGLGSNSIIIKNSEFSCTVTPFKTMVGKGKSKLVLQAAFLEVSDPLTRYRHNQFAKKTGKYLETLLSRIELFSKDIRNVYGLHFSETTLQDSTLISTQKISDSFPVTNDIYRMIDMLEKYMKENGAQPTNKPMVNIRRSENVYQIMVALPITKELPATANITPKRMLAGGKFIESSICKGGMWTLEQYETKMEEYIEDYSYVSPAIPFQSLMTNRMMEKDSNKWETKLFYPIF